MTFDDMRHEIERELFFGPTSGLDSSRIREWIKQANDPEPLTRDVFEDACGRIAYGEYWPTLRDIRALPEVDE